MPTPDELDRLAAMGNALRPDWPTEGLRSHLAANYGARTYRDLAVALTWVAADGKDDPTPLAEEGPWWDAAAPRPAANNTLTTKSGQRQYCPEHHVTLTAGTCGRCEKRAAEHIPGRAAQLWAQLKNQEDQP